MWVVLCKCLGMVRSAKWGFPFLIRSLQAETLLLDKELSGPDMGMGLRSGRASNLTLQKPRTN